MAHFSCSRREEAKRFYEGVKQLHRERVFFRTIAKTKAGASVTSAWKAEVLSSTIRPRSAVGRGPEALVGGAELARSAPPAHGWGVPLWDPLTVLPRS
jgi:hypothetical protein